MEAESSRSSEPAGLIWSRPEKPPRERPTRQAIVRVGVQLADAEGLDAVSIRRVAAELNTRPMGLYTLIDRKYDLIDLMVDEVFAGAVLDELPRNWRRALTAIAHAMYAIFLDHPWMVTAGGQHHVGPNLIRHIEQSLAATADLEIKPAKRLAILRAVDTHAVGQAQIGLSRGQLSSNDTADTSRWRASAQAYVQSLVDTGAYPNLATLGAQGLLYSDHERPSFETGLDWLLDGIAAEITPTRRKTSSTARSR